MKRLVLVIPLLAACAKDLEESKIRLAEVQVKKLADAYLVWATRTDKQCPDSVDDLAEFLNSKDATTDPWGTKIGVVCGPAPEAKEFGAVSAGPDRKPGTSDDIKSVNRR